MHIFNTTLQDFQRPLNTNLEDSIHMPQNHNNRNRRKASSSRRGPPRTSDSPAAPPVNSSEPQAPVIDAFGNTHSVGTHLPSLVGASVSLWPGANVPSSPRQPQRFSTVSDQGQVPAPRGPNEPSGFNANPRQTENTRRPPPLHRNGQEIRDRMRRADFIPFFDTPQTPRVPQSPGSSRPALASKDTNKKLEQKAPPASPAKPPPSPTQKTKTEASFESRKSTGTNDVRPMTVLVEEPSPLNISKKQPGSSLPLPSPILDQVMSLHMQRKRSEKQEKEIAALTKEISEAKLVVQSFHNDEIDMKEPAYHAIYPTQTITVNADLDPRRRSTAAVLESSSDEEFDLLAEDLADMRLYQELLSTPPTPTPEDMRPASAVPAALDLEGIETSRAGRAERSVQVEASKSKVSVVSSAASSFERIATPTGSQTDHNGVRRKWYKGFMR